MRFYYKVSKFTISEARNSPFEDIVLISKMNSGVVRHSAVTEGPEGVSPILKRVETISGRL